MAETKRRRSTGSRGRIRTLKREFFESPTVMSLPSFRTVLTFAGLICVMADDKGRLRDDADLIKAGVWPKRRDVTPDDVAEDLTILSCHLRTAKTSGLIVRYEKKGMKCIWIPSFNEHQRISHPTPSKLPPPPAISRSFAKQAELLAPDLDLEVDVEGRGLGSGTRARKTRAAANGKGRVSHEAPNPEDLKPPKPIRGGAGLEHISAETRRQIEEAKAKTSRSVRE